MIGKWGSQVNKKKPQQGGAETSWGQVQSDPGNDYEDELNFANYLAVSMICGSRRANSTVIFLTRSITDRAVAAPVSAHAPSVD